MPEQVERFNYHVGTVGTGAFAKSADGQWVHYSAWEQVRDERDQGARYVEGWQEATKEAEAERDQAKAQALAEVRERRKQFRQSLHEAIAEASQKYGIARSNSPGSKIEGYWEGKLKALREVAGALSTLEGTQEEDRG